MDYCVICGKPNNAFNYGIYSCNACTMFFRRAIVSKQNFIPCVNAHKCYEEPPFKLKCRLCRFQKCLHCGMKKTVHPSSTSENQLVEVDTKLSSLLSNLHHRDDYFMNLFLNFIPASDVDPTVMDVVHNSNFVKLLPKPPNYPMNLNLWSTLCQYTTMELIKSCDFVSHLNPDDQFTLINGIKMQFILLKFSASAKFEMKDESQFPGGIDIFPVRTGQSFEHNCRYRLLGRLIDLKVTKEEYLLLGILLLCNPAVNGLSDYAKMLITSYQQKFSSFLFQYCQKTYQKEGPARYADLLSLFHVIERGFKDMEAYTFWIKCNYPQLMVKKLVTDSFEDCG